MRSQRRYGMQSPLLSDCGQESIDEIAESVLATFRGLPAKAKPRVYPNNLQEWVPLSGIVLSTGKDDRPSQVECVALGTGMRCLPAEKLVKAKGLCLHDWHAEIVATRSFNLFLLHECNRLALDHSASSSYIRRRNDSEKTETLFQPFEINEDVQIHMYASEAPCGDASMELTMEVQTDATPWALKECQTNDQMALRGRSHFDMLGAVRRKPSRADAPETLSKSCSDKLALKQCTSMLSSLTCLFLTPKNAYLHQLILPDSQFVDSAIERAFAPTGRLASLTDSDGNFRSWNGGFRYQPFCVSATQKRFPFSRGEILQAAKPIGSNITALWTPMRQEVLIGGTIQGNKQFATRGASAISRANMWKFALSVAMNLQNDILVRALQLTSYSQLKSSPLLASRRAVKADAIQSALQNWAQCDMDDFNIG